MLMKGIVPKYLERKAGDSMKRWKRVISFLFAVVCVLGISVPAFAMDVLSSYWTRIQKSLKPVSGSEGYYSFEPDTTEMDEECASIWQDIKSDIYDDSRLVYIYISCTVSGGKYYTNYNFISFDRVSLVPSTTTSRPNGDSSATNINYFFESSDTYQIEFVCSEADGLLRFSGFKHNHTRGPQKIQYGVKNSSNSFGTIGWVSQDVEIPSTIQICSAVKKIVFDDMPIPREYLFTINYQYENGLQAAQPITRSLTAGSSYEITSPTIEGYTADRPIVSGTMPEEDLTVTVNYSAVHPPVPLTYNLTINYRYENGSQAAQPVTRSLTAGSSYEITSPVIEGHTADKLVLSGTMPESDLTVTVTYTANPPPEPQTYTLTVNYRYENGSQAAQSVTRSLTAGSSYEITSPTIKGYTADRTIVSGIMPERDLTIHVLYRKDSSGSSKPSGWFDAAPDVEWKDPFEWFDAAPNVEWKDPFKWFDAAPDVEWWSPFPWGE